MKNSITKRYKTGDAQPQTGGKLPTIYSTMPGVRLRPGMGANAAARQILRYLLERMRANEDGIKADTDIEFLHEYRVAVRRTRVALSQIRNVFPPETVAYYKREFQILSQRTNDLRNLDIFLSTEASYRARLPVGRQEDITPLFDYLGSCRLGAFVAVVSSFESKPYERFLDDWDCFLRQPVGENYPHNARQPIIKLARRIMGRQYSTIMKDGVQALRHPNDEVLHDLRIECKKLRYLLEFFAGLFPPEEVVPLLRQLKRLQDNLGAISDLGDQRNYLYSIAEVLNIDEVQSRRALVAIGFLIEDMGREEQSMRNEFAEVFRRFASRDHQKQFQKLIN